MKEYLFYKKSCPKCHIILHNIDFNKHMKLKFYDMDTEDGITEAAYYDIRTVPALVLESDDLDFDLNFNFNKIINVTTIGRYLN